MCAGLALAFHDGSIHILHRLSLHTMGVFYGSSSSGPGQRPGDDSAIKRQRTAGPALHFKALQFSWTSLALAGVDNHGKVRSREPEPPRAGTASFQKSEPFLWPL